MMKSDATKQIDKEIAGLPDWRGHTLAAIRRIIHQADPEIVEEWKWMGTATFSHDGLVCAADAHTKVVKMIFFKGASVADPAGLFNAELAGSTRRAIKFAEGDRIDERALQKLVRDGVALNLGRAAKKKPPTRRAPAAPKSPSKPRPKPRPKPRSK
jgi:hypothetical protein